MMASISERHTRGDQARVQALLNKVEGRGVQLEADEEVCRVQLRAKAQVDVIRQNADHHKAVIDVWKQQRMGERTDEPSAKLPHATVLASASRTGAATSCPQATPQGGRKSPGWQGSVC